jgi:hypothetical protein
MTTSIDTNIIVALWRNTDSSNRVAAELLDQAQKRGRLVVSAPVYAELMADPARSENELNEFAARTGIAVDWNIDEDVWREAGRAYRGYARRRIRSGGDPPRRILADFVIGAHAVLHGHTLITLDRRRYAAAFPRLRIVPE